MPSLRETDPAVAGILDAENYRQHRKIRLIPSENYSSRAVLEATGSILTNKYSEGYAGDRYYEGQQQIDRIEELCVQRAKELFGAEHVNVQPYSGSPANQAVYVRTLQAGGQGHGHVAGSRRPPYTWSRGKRVRPVLRIGGVRRRPRERPARLR